MSDLQSLAEKFSNLDPVNALWIVREPDDKDRPLPRQWQFETPADVRRNCLRELIAHDEHFLLAARDASVLNAFVELAADAGRCFGGGDDKTVAACCWLRKLCKPQPTVEEIAFGRAPWYAELENATDKSADRLQIESPPADGPIGGGFRWAGQDRYGLSGKAWLLVKYLWSKGDRTATFDELAGPVWNDRECAPSSDAIGSLRRNANKWFKRERIPRRISTNGQTVYLKPE